MRVIQKILYYFYRRDSYVSYLYPVRGLLPRTYSPSCWNFFEVLMARWGLTLFPFIIRVIFLYLLMV